MSTNIYILRLEGGNYYVGKSDNPAQRFQQHMNGKGATWTKIHKPVKLVKVIEKASHFDEDKHVKELMAKYGIDKVRGGTYVQETLSELQEESLKKEIRGATDCCTRCGNTGHFVATCYAKKDTDGKEIEDEELIEVWCCEYCDKEYEDEDECLKHEKRCPRKPKSPKSKSPAKKSGGACYRCGRTSHWSPDCYATTHVDGYELSSDEDEDSD